MEKIKLSAVAYHNTRPFLYGLERSPLADQLDISLDIPAEGARKLQRGLVKLALVPVGVLNSVPKARIFSQWCIGCDGPVQTVCLYAQKPIEELSHIWLDYHSVTSVRLLTLLLREYWKLKPDLVPASPGFRTRIEGRTGALVIGDRAIGLEREYPFVYDLGQVWKEWTGLPFVFAVWVSTRDLDPDFVRVFNAALGDGVGRIAEMVGLEQVALPPQFDLMDYLTKKISYPLDEPKRQALERFLRLLNHAPARWWTGEHRSEFSVPG